MDQRTLTALKGSIAKWQAIVDGHGQDRGTKNCPLCQLFHEDFTNKPDCIGCPVAQAAEASCCVNTLYTEYRKHEETPEAHEHALAELRFLESLLPKESS